MGVLRGMTHDSVPRTRELRFMRAFFASKRISLTSLFASPHLRDELPFALGRKRRTVVSVRGKRWRFNVNEEPRFRYFPLWHRNIEDACEGLRITIDNAVLVGRIDVFVDRWSFRNGMRKNGERRVEWDKWMRWLGWNWVRIMKSRGAGNKYFITSSKYVFYISSLSTTFIFDSTSRNKVISSSKLRFYFEEARLLINAEGSLPYHKVRH